MIRNENNLQLEVGSGVREWSNLILRRRYSVGFAARSNRGSYSGTKLHQIAIEEVIGLKDESVPQPKGTVGARFLIARRPVVFSAYPLCGCTQGQNAARESVGAKVTCSKCGG